jgi:hypothetical protein
VNLTSEPPEMRTTWALQAPHAPRRCVTRDLERPRRPEQIAEELRNAVAADAPLSGSKVRGLGGTGSFMAAR